MANWTGAKSQGPFGKMLEIANSLGWHLAPPYVEDHDGVRWHLPTCNMHHLEQALRDAWAQRSGRRCGYTARLCRTLWCGYLCAKTGAESSEPYGRKWLSTLRDGTFVEPAHQQKFDTSQSGNCILCGERDTIHHRLFQCPRLVRARQDYPDLFDHSGTLSTSLAIRLLPSRNPYLGSFRNGLAQLGDIVEQLPFSDPPSGLHLFTDGSGSRMGSAGYNRRHHLKRQCLGSEWCSTSTGLPEGHPG